MIHRNVRDRLEHVAGFLLWDHDPYMVITDDGRLVWMLDGYTTSLSHPYSATLAVAGLDDGANYIRNAVKATVDAYTGKMSLYVFDPSDPIIQSTSIYSPKLFLPLPKCPPTCAATPAIRRISFNAGGGVPDLPHARSAGVLQQGRRLGHRAQRVRPVRAAGAHAADLRRGHLAREKQPEFLLMLPFTPRGKDNLIGWMAARCDGDHLGELIFFQLSEAATGVRPHAD